MKHPLPAYLLLSLVFGLLIGLSPQMALENDADSLLPVHLSIEQPDSFYWGQNRFGMLLPKLASFVKDPWSNLFVQQTASAGVSVFGLLGFGVLFGMCHARSLAVGLASLCLLVGTQSSRTLHILFMTAQPYGLSLGLFVGAVWVLKFLWGELGCKWAGGTGRQRFRWLLCLIVAVALLNLVLWVNLSLVPYAALVIVAARAAGSHRATPLLLLALAAAAALHLWVFRQDRQEILPASVWPQAVGHHLVACARGHLNLRVLAAMLLVAVAVAFGFSRGTLAADSAKIRALALLLAGCFALSLLVAVNTWVSANQFHSRYSSNGLLLATSALMALAILMASPPRRTTRALVVALLPLSAGICMATLGVPDIAAARSGLLQTSEKKWGLRVQDLDHHRPQFLIGEYYFAWTAGFLVNAERGRMHIAERVLVISGRSHAIRDRIGDVAKRTPPPLLAAGASHDKQFTTYLPQVFLESRRTFSTENGVRTDELQRIW